MADYGIFSPATARQVLADLRALKAAVFGGGVGVVPQLGSAPIYVHNVSGEEIPAYACMQATGTEVIGDRTYIQVDQPADSTGEAGGFLFNSPSPIPIDGNGIANAGPHVKALGDGSTATAGDRWAPVASSWSIAPDAEGFLICSGDDDVATDVVRVISIGGGGGGSTIFVAELTAAWSTNSAACEIYSMDGNTLTFVENSTVFDPLAAFDVLSTGDRLYVTKQANKYYAANNAPCPTGGGGAPEPL